MVNGKYLSYLTILSVLWIPVLFSFESSANQPDSYLSWSEKMAVSIGKSSRIDGRVGGRFDGRIVHTEHSYNYKLRATFMTPEVIRASARITQIKNYLTDTETRALVAEAEKTGDLVVMVEIDPREGSGVIPTDWLAILKEEGTSPGNSGGIRGANTPELIKCKALGGVMRRDYDYDVFWIVFTLHDEKGNPLLSGSIKKAELIVRIYNKEGKVSWEVPDSIRAILKSAR